MVTLLINAILHHAPSQTNLTKIGDLSVAELMLVGKGSNNPQPLPPPPPPSTVILEFFILLEYFLYFDTWAPKSKGLLVLDVISSVGSINTLGMLSPWVILGQPLPDQTSLNSLFYTSLIFSQGSLKRFPNTNHQDKTPNSSFILEITYSKIF